MTDRSKSRLLAWFGSTAALVALATLAPAAQNGSRFRVESVPEISGRAIHVDKALLQREREAVGRGQSRNVSVIVRLAGEPLASYAGSVPGMAATTPRATGRARLDVQSPASRQYLAFLNGRQATVRASLRAALPAARVVHDYQVAFNGLAVVVPDAQVSQLAAVPGVEAIYEDQLLSLNTDTSPSFINAPQVWNQLGGQESAGEGVIVGVIDSGIWPEHPSLSDPDPSGKPYAAPPGAARPCQFSGGGQPGPAFSCNNKLIGARRLMATYDALVGLLPTEYTTARDDNGHGSHTATTAAGNGGVAANLYGQSFGTVSGIAPRAHVMAYKVCGDQGCYGSDSAAAVQQAVLDGVDVINFSISGGANPYSDSVSLAFLGAYDAGVFVAASAGNSGPGPDTTDHREPWTTTVAASTSDRQFQGTVTLTAAGGATLALNGASITTALAVPAPVFVPPTDTLCQTPFAPGSVAGQVVVCVRGVNARVAKSYNVAVGGAVGMILVNPSLQGIGTDNHFVPTVHLENGERIQLHAFLSAHPTATATFSQGAAAPAQGDVMATFSSRGGAAQTLGVSKPDVTAPGVQILAGHTPAPATQEGGFPGQLFQAIQGTSMSSPHVAGAGALLRALHPTWTPGQIRSALMTTAVGTVVKEDGVTPAGPFDFGSGRIDLARAADPGLLLDETAANYVAMMSNLWDANYPSVFVPGFPGQITVQRRLQNTRAEDRAWQIHVSAPADLQVTVPNTLALPAHGTATLDISVDGRGIAVGQARHALLELTRPNESTIRIPITVVRGASQVPLSKSCSPLTFPQGASTDCTISITNTTFTPANVVLTDLLPNPLRMVSGSVVGATQTGNGLRFSGAIAPAQPASVAVSAGLAPAGYLPLSLFGIGPIAGVGDETIVNFNVPGFTYAGEVYTRVALSSNGYLVVGGGTAPDNDFVNQNFPNPNRPNNVLAPFWTDLNPAFAGAMRIGTLTDGVSTWLVADWAGVREYSQPRLASFQIWIGLNGVQDISFTYGTIQGNGDGGALTVGAENRFGNRGQAVYFNGTGTLPALGTELVVSSAPGTPGETRTITFSAVGRTKGAWTNCAEMTSNIFYGTQTACVSGTVTK